MLFNLLPSFPGFQSSQFSTPDIIPSWYIVYGHHEKLKDIAKNCLYQNQQLAVISPYQNIAFSPSQRFIIIGDIWLSNKTELLNRLTLNQENITNQEIIAQLWEQHGSQCLNLLLGIFALVIFDQQTQELSLIRDAIGGKTLYYTINQETCYIAPKLRNLSPFHQHNIDIISLRDYLCCAFVPGARTLWENVKELRPGTWIKLPSEQVFEYWQLQEKVLDFDQDINWYSQKLRTLLEQVVKEYLPLNQPVGVFLSGGLDSSSITALAAKFHDQKIHTYSIHFGAETANELEFSSLVAAHCQTEHHILEITFDDMWKHLLATMIYLDDPIGDPLTVPNLLVGKLAKNDVDVILNGEGGDPCFGGPKNQPMLINSLYGYVNNQDILSAYLISFQKCASDLPQLLNWEIWKSLKDVNSVFIDDLQTDVNYLNKLMMLNIKFKGADHILTKVNNLTQANNLLGLSPLFDRRIVDFSMQILPEYKLSGVEEKAVLKQAVRDILPEKIIYRPKSGMMVPVQLGFRKYWQKQARKLLLNKNSMLANYINYEVLYSWLSFQGDIWGRYGVKLWLLVSLELWLQGNKN